MSKNITLDDGTEIPVTDEVYEEYNRSKWREENQKRSSLKHEVSFDHMAEIGDEISTVHNQKLVDEIVEDKLMLEILMSALDELTADERYIIDEIYFNDKTERQLSGEKNIPQKTINNRKNSILKKLFKNLKK